MRFAVITLFPELVVEVFNYGVLRRGVEKGLIEYHLISPRDFTIDRYRTVDDESYGGGPGMVMKPEPLYASIKEAKRLVGDDVKVIFLTPRGTLFQHELARNWAMMDNLTPQGASLILLSGRYEGIDERIVENFVDEEISIGDYVLSGGELAAMVVMDAVCRFLPGVVGKEESVVKDSFEEAMLDYPVYTRPPDFLDLKVPEILLSGDHKKIEEWRRARALEITMKRRPDLLLGMRESDVP